MGGCALLLALCILLATRVSLPRVQRAPAITIASGAPLRIVASREGTILSLEVREGQRVAAGEVIAKLSNAENEEMATRELVERDESRDEKSLADQQMGRN
jgi:multidrug efflux pump subunit AcrA (membrane-fusion protein)